MYDVVMLWLTVAMIMMVNEEQKESQKQDKEENTHSDRKLID